MKNKQPIIENMFHYKGYVCCVIFQTAGYRCGYVLVPYWHPVYTVKYDDIDISCHGSLTYSGHRLLDREYPGWWIGFDCAHAGDAIDRNSLIKYYDENGLTEVEKRQCQFMTAFGGPLDIGGTYGTVKTLDFCMEECKKIVDQLVEME